MSVSRQFMDQTCEIITKISCEVAFLTGMVEQLRKENDDLKGQLQFATQKKEDLSPKSNGVVDDAQHPAV